MVMSLWWVTLLLLLAGIAAWAIAYWNRRSVRRSPVVVANSEFLERVPSFARAQRTARALRVVLVPIAVLGLVGASVLSGRVGTERIQTPKFANRDIVLCLDVSGSMYQFDTEILSTFSQMVDGFEGERLGLSIFNSTSRTAFPLTNDYDLIRTELQKDAEAIDFDEQGYRLGTRQYSPEKRRMFADFIAGTRGVDDQASLVPDGLAACAQEFDHAEADRSRSIIFATDNEVNGEPIFQLDEAAAALDARGIQLYTFYPGASECSATCADELKTVTEGHGGHFYSSSDPNAIPSILASIQKTQAQEMGATPRVVRTDMPMFGFLVALVAMAGLVITGWRAR
ncbi:vWA domain-containing protein [Brachybacterium huguangmaarense]